MGALPDSAVCFARAVAALGGVTAPMTAAGSKMLRFMLEHDAGCDAWLTPKAFVVQYGWHLSHHRYFSDVAVEVTSWLVEHLGDQRGVLAGGEVPARDRFPGWSYGARAVWIDAEPDKITILIRAAQSPTLPATRPDPLELSRTIEHIVGSWPCPSCGQTPHHYRKLDQKSVVCLACGASSPPRS